MKQLFLHLGCYPLIQFDKSIKKIKLWLVNANDKKFQLYSFNMGNTDKNKSKKCRRKIRIRLVDPSIPDSYVCEIFDSSLENEDEISKNEEPLSEENEDHIKPQNYFELLMSKKCNKSCLVKTSNENILSQSNDEASFLRKKQLNQSNKNFLTKSFDEKNEMQNIGTDSSEDESLLQIQSRCKLKNIESKQNLVADIAEEKMHTEDIKTKEVLTILDSQKTQLSHKKTISILKYFSKREISPKLKLHCDKLEEITVQNSIKTCQANILKLNKKKNLNKTCKNEKNISLNNINKENFKLAPLFNKKENKIIDVERQKARLEFLYKGSPLIPKKSENKTSECVSVFQRVVHIQQRNSSAFWSQREVCLPLPLLPHYEEAKFNSTKKFRMEIEQLNVVRNVATIQTDKITKEVLAKIKCKYLELNLDLIIDGLIEKRNRFLVRAEEIEKLKNIGIQQSNDEIGFEEVNSLWTEKYKPKSFEILGNGNVQKKFKKWLESWKSFDKELKVLVKSNRTLKNQKESDCESDDDFLDYGGENFGLKAPCNVCIISGPNGCGKTSLVYALANELEFAVLELNASSKRTGKKVLADLQEATQSHKVHRVNLFQNEEIQKDLKKKKNKKAKKNKKIQEPANILDQVNDCKISLILIEDADIIFDEHDEGFFSAIASLVQTSKRPLIFLTNEPNCHLLYNLKTEQCLILEMEFPNFYKSCAILEIVSSLEGACFDKEFFECLVLQNNFDFRKCLLQLQFWIHSNKKALILEERFDIGRLWWGLSKFLYKQDMKHYVKPKTRKRKRMNDLFDSSDDELEKATKKFKSNVKTLENCSVSNTSAVSKKSDPTIGFYSGVLDLASNLDVFCTSGSQEPIPELECKPKDGLSLNENMEEVSWVRKSLAEQFSEEMISLSTRIFARQLKERENENRKLSFASPCWDEIRWRNSRKKASEELSVLTSLQRGRDKRSLHLDYLPILRNICRLERNRSEMNPKRKNRFYHYLNNFGVELTDENLDINCEVFDG